MVDSPCLMAGLDTVNGEWTWLAAIAALIASMFLSGAAFAQDKAPPADPDAEYCSRRDADPKKCLIQDGQLKFTVRKPPPPSPRSLAEKARWKTRP